MSWRLSDDINDDKNSASKSTTQINREAQLRISAEEWSRPSSHFLLLLLPHCTSPPPPCPGRNVPLNSRPLNTNQIWIWFSFSRFSFYSPPASLSLSHLSMCECVSSLLLCNITVCNSTTCCCAFCYFRGHYNWLHLFCIVTRSLFMCNKIYEQHAHSANAITSASSRTSKAALKLLHVTQSWRLIRLRHTAQTRNLRRSKQT